MKKITLDTLLRVLDHENADSVRCFPSQLDVPKIGVRCTRPVRNGTETDFEHDSKWRLLFIDEQHGVVSLRTLSAARMPRHERGFCSVANEGGYGDPVTLSFLGALHRQSGLFNEQLPVIGVEYGGKRTLRVPCGGLANTDGGRTVYWCDAAGVLSASDMDVIPNRLWPPAAAAAAAAAEPIGVPPDARPKMHCPQCGTLSPVVNDPGSALLGTCPSCGVIFSALGADPPKSTLGLRCPKCNHGFEVPKDKLSPHVACPACKYDWDEVALLKIASREERAAAVQSAVESAVGNFRCPACGTFLPTATFVDGSFKCPQCGKASEFVWGRCAPSTSCTITAALGVEVSAGAAVAAGVDVADAVPPAEANKATTTVEPRKPFSGVEARPDKQGSELCVEGTDISIVRLLTLLAEGDDYAFGDSYLKPVARDLNLIPPGAGADPRPLQRCLRGLADWFKTQDWTSTEPLGEQARQRGYQDGKRQALQEADEAARYREAFEKKWGRHIAAMDAGLQMADEQKLIEKLSRFIVDETDRQEAFADDPEYDAACFKSVWEKMGIRDRGVALAVGRKVFQFVEAERYKAMFDADRALPKGAGYEALARARLILATSDEAVGPLVADARKVLETKAALPNMPLEVAKAIIRLYESAKSAAPASFTTWSHFDVQHRQQQDLGQERFDPILADIEQRSKERKEKRCGTCRHRTCNQLTPDPKLYYCNQPGGPYGVAEKGPLWSACRGWSPKE